MKYKSSGFFSFRIHILLISVFTTVFSLFLLLPSINNYLRAAPLDKIPSDTRCPVCGMFVAKYDVWITQLRINDDSVLSFDGVKDMMAFYFSPDS